MMKIYTDLEVGLCVLQGWELTGWELNLWSSWGI